MIKFGSRTDVVFPLPHDLCVRVGDRVKGGSSVLARMRVAQPNSSARTGESRAVQAGVKRSEVSK
jgi:phosphatidylserine decarboxylase